MRVGQQVNHRGAITDQADVLTSAVFNHQQSPPGFVMKSWLAATLMFMTAGGSAEAQMAAPSTAGTKPRAVVTVPIRPPALQTPADTANAMGQSERLALQSDLAWVGEYNGAITGDVSERMVAAIKDYQKAKGGRPTGVLNPQERRVLAETARRR